MGNTTRLEVLALTAFLVLHVAPLGCDGRKRLHEQGPLSCTYLEERLTSDLLIAMSPRSRALFLFGMCLWLGGQFWAMAERCPWEPDVSLDDVIDHQPVPDDDELPAAGLTHALIEEVVRIQEKLITVSVVADRVVFPSYRMAMRSIGCPRELLGAFRFLFASGLVGSGITPSWDEDMCCDEAGADVQPVGQDESGDLSHG